MAKAKLYKYMYQYIENIMNNESIMKTVYEVCNHKHASHKRPDIRN